MSVSLNTRGLELFEKRLRMLSHRKVREGFSGMHPSGETNASLAYILERGRRGDDHQSHIPPRPSFTDSMLRLKNNGFSFVAQLKYTEYLRGEISQQQFLKELGKFMKNNHRDTLEFWYLDGSSATHNAPLTVAKKGFDQPLVEHKDLLNSIKYEVI